MSGNSRSVLSVIRASRGEGSHGGEMRAIISCPFLAFLVARIKVDVMSVKLGYGGESGTGVKRKP
jgi:hypothetical protein